MEFAWNDTDADIGYYECALIEENKKIETICFTDYTNAWQQENARNSHYYREYSFRISYCCGYSMEQGVDYDQEYRRRKDENGKILYGFNGTCTHTVEDVKRWCEEYLAQMYIKSYANLLASIESAKRRAEWFMENGYGNMALDVSQ